MSRSKRRAHIVARVPNAKLVELEGEDHLIFAGDVEAIIDEIEEFSYRRPRLRRTAACPRHDPVHRYRRLDEPSCEARRPSLAGPAEPARSDGAAGTRSFPRSRDQHHGRRICRCLRWPGAGDPQRAGHRRCRAAIRHRRARRHPHGRVRGERHLARRYRAAYRCPSCRDRWPRRGAGLHTVKDLVAGSGIVFANRGEVIRCAEFQVSGRSSPRPGRSGPADPRPGPMFAALLQRPPCAG